MGRLSAEELLDHTDLPTAIVRHLRGNHYPPVPTTMLEPCIEAIEAIQEGDIHRHIHLPAGILYKGEPTAPAHAIAQSHHLDAFIQREDAS